MKGEAAAQTLGKRSMNPEAAVPAGLNLPVASSSRTVNVVHTPPNVGSVDPSQLRTGTPEGPRKDAN